MVIFLLHERKETNMLKRTLSKIDKYYFFLFLISIALLLPLLNYNYFYGHDTGFHIANSMAFRERLDWPNLFNIKILPIMANNFGYGTNIFYPNLPHFITALIYNYLNVSIFTSIKITDFFLIFFSGVTMYTFMKTITKKKTLSFVSTLFYITAPYKIYDYLYRDALAESFVFVFLPLIFLGIYFLLHQQYKRFYFYFIIGYVGLLNSHLVMGIYITIFLGIFLLFHFKKVWNKETILRLLLATFIVILISLPFLIPLLTHMIKGKYVAFTSGEMSNRFGVYGNGLFLFQFLIGWKKVGFHIINWFALGLIIYLLYKLKKENKLQKMLKTNDLFSMGFICAFLGIWLSSHLFPWFLLPNFLLMIQFPYRLGVLTSFGVSILSYYALKKCNSKKIIVLSILSCILFASLPMIMQKYDKENLNYYNLSVEGMGYQEEYLPIRTKNNKEYFENRNEEVLLLDGNADIYIINNDTPNLIFRVANTSYAKLELPRLYYLGYNIKAIDSNGNKTSLDYKESEYGFIEMEVDRDATIEVTYENTKVGRIGNKVSMVTVILFITYLFMKKEKNNEKGND